MRLLLRYSQPRGPTRNALKWLALGAGAAALTYLLVASRGALLAAAVPLLIPLLQRLARQRIGGIAGGTAGATNDRSTITTRYLLMHLDHASGELYGEVIDGPFAGSRLDELAAQELEQLWRGCMDDPQSAAALENWLDRALPDWRERFGAAAAGSDGGAGSEPLSDIDEALALLGLRRGASRDEIKTAHRRLMQRVHPDHGGSDYLAARINAAKDLLLGDDG